MTKHFVFLIPALLVVVACSEDGSGLQEEDGGHQEEVEVLGLGACSSRGGGRLHETQCNKGWDCLELGIFEILCYGDGVPEACTCLHNDEEVASFAVEEAGGFSDAFSTGDFAANVVEACGFPGGHVVEE